MPASPDNAPKGFLSVDYPKRLIEVDLPIKRISAHARREKSIRHGHISTLHIWWARRPLAACRAVICAALWPDPADKKCPPAFRDEARRLMADWAHNHLELTSPESMSRFNRVKNDPSVLVDNLELRKALLDFIADFADWDNSTRGSFVATARSLTKSSHESLGGSPHSRPLVLDPFAGGGSIPLEASRVGADAFASDLNPIPVLLNRVALEYIPRFGEELAGEIERWGDRIATEAAKQLADFYPPSRGEPSPSAYLWARTIVCEGPGCGAVVPLLRSLWLRKTKSQAIALHLTTPSTKQIELSIVRKEKSGWVTTTSPPRAVRDMSLQGTVQRGSVTCPCCGHTTPLPNVKAQLRKAHGGANSARLVAVIVRVDGELRFRPPARSDEVAVTRARDELATRRKTHTDQPSLVPDESTEGYHVFVNRGPLYGMNCWSDYFTDRQLLAYSVFMALIKQAGESLAREGKGEIAKPVMTCLTFALDKCLDYGNACVSWMPRGTVGHLFARQAIPMTWDFPEANPTSDFHCSWREAFPWAAAVCRQLTQSDLLPGTVVKASATQHPAPDDSVQALITDPPYYYSVQYADLADFFYVWLRRSIGHLHPDLFTDVETPKADEIIVQSPSHQFAETGKNKTFFESRMYSAMKESRRVLEPSGIGVVVFAHTSTSGWEAQLQAMIDAGWILSASWPIDTEREARMLALDRSVLASSVHLVCRPREHTDGAVRDDDTGDWRSVLEELPRRIHEWMPRLADEGVVGADAIFACLGPALEIFSRYSRVEKASGEVVTLREYLEQVWAAVSTEALSMIFRDADAAGLESDSRFTAIVLWTLGAGGSGTGESTGGELEEAEDGDDDEEESPKGKAAKGGYTLEYDAARKIAQGLGVNLEQIDSVVEVKGDKARLRSVSERAATLFGKAETAEAATKKRGKKATQKKLFDKNAEEGGSTADTVTIGEGTVATPGVTALDRVHQAMLLFASGRADALKRFIIEDGVGGDARFWKLAQSLSALYPAGSDEKRWVDGVLARKKSFGF